MTLDDNSKTLFPLPDVLSHGLVAVSTFGLLSFFCSTSLFLYLTYKILSWRRKSGGNKPINQFLFLIYNLLLADIQQALAFLLNITALRNNAIIVGTPTCFAQGWLVSTGDLASSVFICTIALHTFFAVIKDYRLPTAAFYSTIAALWAFTYGLALIGPLLHRHDFYVRASAWCWINDSYQNERLWLHYFWIFVLMFSTVIIYVVIVITLQTRSRRQELSDATAHRTTPLMILYPLIYVVCTSPLAVGRIVALAGTTVSLQYFTIAGTMIACNGWLDVLLYASTRSEIVFTESLGDENTGLETFAFLGKRQRFGTTTTVEVEGRRNSGESFVNLYLFGLQSVQPKGVTVKTEVIQDSHPMSPVSASGSWETRSVRSVTSSKSSEV